MPSCTAITVPTLAVSTSGPPKPVMLFSMMALISSAQVAIVVPPRFQDFSHLWKGEAWVNRATTRGHPGRPHRHVSMVGTALVVAPGGITLTYCILLDPTVACWGQPLAP